MVGEFVAVLELVVIAGLLYLLRVEYTMRVLAVKRADVATERLYAAWKDGYNIPEVTEPVVQEPVKPLHRGLQALVDEWEGDDAQRKMESVIRGMLAQPGATEESVYQALNKPTEVV